MQFENVLLRLAPYVLSVLRIAAALLFLEHGTSRLFGFPSPLPTPPLFSLYWFAGAIELVGGALLLLGLFTRPAALIMSGEMAFAYFLSHAPHGFFPILNRGDGAILYCFTASCSSIWCSPDPARSVWTRSRVGRRRLCVNV